MVFILASTTLNASTCTPLKTSVLANCEYGGCHELIFITEELYGIECARRSVISPAPDWAKRVIEYEINTSMQLIMPATYQLNMTYYRSWISEKDTNLEQYISKRTEYEYTNQIRLYKYPKKEFLKLKFKWQLDEKLGYLMMIITYLFNGCLIFLIAVIEYLFFYGHDENKHKLTMLSFCCLITLLYCSLNFPLEQFNLLIAIVFIPLLFVLNILFILINKVQKIID